MVTHFFSCIIAEKKPKIQTHCGKWSWRIKNKDFWRIKMFSILLQEWEGWSRFCKRYHLEITGTVLISDGTHYLTQHAAPKRKDSALFLWQWPMTNGKKISLEHKQYSRGRASVLRSRSFGSSRNTPVLMGRKRNKERASFINNCIAKWRSGSWSIQGLPLLASNP